MRDQNPRLGRGLAALLGDGRPTSTGQPSGELDIQALEPGAFQPRAAIGLDSLADLVASIRTRGILQPLLVRPHPNKPDRFQIIAGERRWRAAQEVGLTAIPCLVRPMTDADATAAALVENLQRVDLDPIEEAEGFRRLVDEFGLTQEELGVAIGKSRSHVANALRLLALPQSVRDYVRSGALTPGHARAALASADPAAAADIMVAKGLSVREAEALSTATPRTHTSKREKIQTTTDPDLRAVETELAEKLGMEVSIAFNGKGGTVKVVYRTLDQLDHIIARLGGL